MANVTTELQPFRLPNYVLEEVEPSDRQEGFKETPKHRLCDLPEKTLIMLCDEFKEGILRKARKMV